MRERGPFKETLLLALRQAGAHPEGVASGPAALATGRSRQTIKRYMDILVDRGMVMIQLPDGRAKDGSSLPVLYFATLRGLAEIRRHDTAQADPDLDGIVRANLVPRFGGVYVPTSDSVYYRNNGNRHISSRGTRC